MSQDKTKVEISVCLIASNEEANMEDCLKSVRDIASEVILVHNDCRDDTVKIAERYGARCFEEKWHGHRNQKNIALGKPPNLGSSVSMPTSACPLPCLPPSRLF